MAREGAKTALQDLWVTVSPWQPWRLELSLGIFRPSLEKENHEVTLSLHLGYSPYHLVRGLSLVEPNISKNS